MEYISFGCNKYALRLSEGMRLTIVRVSAPSNCSFSGIGIPNSAGVYVSRSSFSGSWYITGVVAIPWKEHSGQLMVLMFPERRRCLTPLSTATSNIWSISTDIRCLQRGQLASGLEPSIAMHHLMF